VVGRLDEIEQPAAGPGARGQQLRGDDRVPAQPRAAGHSGAETVWRDTHVTGGESGEG